MSMSRPLSGAGIHVDESKVRADGCMYLYPSLVHMFSRLIFPILSLLCPCFLQFLSTFFPLLSLLIRGTPQRCRIIPVRSTSLSCPGKTRWRECCQLYCCQLYCLSSDTCISFPGLAVSLSFYLPPLSLPCSALVFTHVYVPFHYGAYRFCRGRD